MGSCSPVWRWVAWVALTAPAVAQSLTIACKDGEDLDATLVGIAGVGPEANLEVQVDGQSRTIPLANVLGLHGAAPRPTGGATAQLVGGDQVCGELSGGDASGESFTIRSPSLGDLRFAVDRLQVVLLPRAGDKVRPEQFVVPAGAAEEEAVFRRAERGYDMIAGAICGFTEQGLLFEWAEQAKPSLLPYDQLAAIALRGGIARDEPAAARLLTRSGDVLGCELLGIRDGKIEVRLEGGVDAELPWSELAALVPMGKDRVFLSDLEPIRVDERGAPFDGVEMPLYRWRRDRACNGGFLSCGGRAYVKGLGVHARCLLTYRVPEGWTRFSGRVGLDDSATATNVRGHATVSVKLDEDTVFGPADVHAGQAPVKIDSPVRPGALLTLVVDFGEGWFLGDRVNWLNAVLLRP